MVVAFMTSSPPEGPKDLISTQATRRWRSKWDGHHLLLTLFYHFLFYWCRRIVRQKLVKGVVVVATLTRGYSQVCSHHFSLSLYNREETKRNNNEREKREFGRSQRNGTLNILRVMSTILYVQCLWAGDISGDSKELPAIANTTCSLTHSFTHYAYAS